MCIRDSAQDALVALCAAMFAIVVWATLAWWFGIPTSESHAPVSYTHLAQLGNQAGLLGAAELARRLAAGQLR